jgi:predicted esterase
MKSKNWSRRSVLACGIISLLACGSAAAQPAAKKTPAIALVDGADAAQWRNWSGERGWQVIAPAGPANPSIDLRVQALASAVEDAIRNSGADPARVYLAGRGDAAAAVFYAISRVPDLWAAGVALGGSPKPAIDTQRVFAANFTNVPVLWIGGADDQALADKLKAAGLNLEWRPAASGPSAAAVFEWLAGHQRDEFPVSIDCETNSPAFARCYWIQMSRFDANERNDVLPPTRVPGGSGAALDLGSFSYQTGDPGPGVLVSSLGEKYSGPLKVGDRIVALDGKEISNARQFAETMDKAAEEKPVVVMVQRGKQHVRVETRIVLPRRDAGVTARVEAQYLPADNEIQIVSRMVRVMRVTVPPHWLPATLYWNGLSLENLKEPGCWVLALEKELLHATKCR